jgi:hypothetical protein
MPSSKLSKTAEDTRAQLVVGLRALMEAAGKKVVSLRIVGDQVVYVIDEPEAGERTYRAKIPPEQVAAMEAEDALRSK